MWARLMQEADQISLKTAFFGSKRVEIRGFCLLGNFVRHSFFIGYGDRRVKKGGILRGVGSRGIFDGFRPGMGGLGPFHKYCALVDRNYLQSAVGL